MKLIRDQNCNLEQSTGQPQKEGEEKKSKRARKINAMGLQDNKKNFSWPKINVLMP